jgi:hypothetical protein
MFGMNIILLGDFLTGFCIAWVLRGLCDKWEGKLSHLFKRKNDDE